MPKSLNQIDSELTRFYSPLGHAVSDARLGVLVAARDARRGNVVPMFPCAVTTEQSDHERWMAGYHLETTPQAAARVATVTVSERFNHDHFQRVLSARQFLVGE